MSYDLSSKAPKQDRHEALAEAVAKERPSPLPWILLPFGLALLAGIAYWYGPTGDEPAAFADLLILCVATIPIVLGSLFLVADILKTNFGTFASAVLNLSSFLVFAVAGYLLVIHLLSFHSVLLAVGIAGFGLVCLLIFAKLFDIPVFTGLFALLMVAAVETGLVVLLEWLFALTVL